MLAFLILVPLHTQQEVVLHFTPVFLRVGRRLATSRSVAFMDAAATTSTRRCSFPFVHIVPNATTLPTALPTLHEGEGVVGMVRRAKRLQGCGQLRHVGYCTKYSDMKFDGSMWMVPHAART